MTISPAMLKLSTDERLLVDTLEKEIDAEIFRQNDELRERKKSLAALKVIDNTATSTPPQTQCFEIILKNHPSDIVCTELTKRYKEVGWVLLRFGITESEVKLWIAG